MGCANCKPVYSGMCREHFVLAFEKKVLGAIKKHEMISRKDSVCVAVSGGKDSMVMLDILRRRWDVEALAIDEGIHGYREHTLNWLKEYCVKNKVRLRIISFKEEYGITLDSLSGKNPCTECGKRRRMLLNKYAEGFDRLAVGHNLDDTAQTILMNLFKCTLDMVERALPMSASNPAYVQRIKPLYYCTEKEVLLYAVLKGLAPPFAECPYMHDSFRNDVRNALSSRQEKENIVKKYLSLMKV